MDTLRNAKRNKEDEANKDIINLGSLSFAEYEARHGARCTNDTLGDGDLGTSGR